MLFGVGSPGAIPSINNLQTQRGAWDRKNLVALHWYNHLNHTHIYTFTHMRVLVVRVCVSFYMAIMS